MPGIYFFSVTIKIFPNPPGSYIESIGLDPLWARYLYILAVVTQQLEYIGIFHEVDCGKTFLYLLKTELR